MASVQLLVFNNHFDGSARFVSMSSATGSWVAADDVTVLPTDLDSSLATSNIQFYARVYECGTGNYVALYEHFDYNGYPYGYSQTFVQRVTVANNGTITIGTGHALNTPDQFGLGIPSSTIRVTDSSSLAFSVTEDGLWLLAPAVATSPSYVQYVQVFALAGDGTPALAQTYARSTLRLTRTAGGAFFASNEYGEYAAATMERWEVDLTTGALTSTSLSNPASRSTSSLYTYSWAGAFTPASTRIDGQDAVIAFGLTYDNAANQLFASYAVLDLATDTWGSWLDLTLDPDGQDSNAQSPTILANPSGTYAVYTQGSDLSDLYQEAVTQLSVAGTTLTAVATQVPAIPAAVISAGDDPSYSSYPAALSSSALAQGIYDSSTNQYTILMSELSASIVQQDMGEYPYLAHCFEVLARIGGWQVGSVAW